MIKALLALTLGATVACASNPKTETSERHPAARQLTIEENDLPPGDMPLGSFTHASPAGISYSKVYRCFDMDGANARPRSLDDLRIVGHQVPAGNIDFPNNFVASMWDTGVGGPVNPASAKECPKIQVKANRKTVVPGLLGAHPIMDAKLSGVTCVYTLYKNPGPASGGGLSCDFSIPKPAEFKYE